MDIQSSFENLYWVKIYYEDQKLLLVTINPTETDKSSEMIIYTIDLPMGNNAKYVGMPSIKRKDAATKWEWILLVMGTAIIGFGIFVWRRKQFSTIVNQSSILEKTPKAPQIKMVNNGGLKKGVSIQIEGDFQLWVDGTQLNLDGNERHNQIVQLLILVANAPEYKISHEDIHQSLWPLVQDESFVNSLNVTLSALRKVITPYEKEIIHHAKMVAFGERIKVIHAI